MDTQEKALKVEEFCETVKTVGELREAIKNLPSDMKLDLTAHCYEDADHYLSRSISHNPYDKDMGATIFLQTNEHRKIQECEGSKKGLVTTEMVLNLSNEDWDKFVID